MQESSASIFVGLHGRRQSSFLESETIELKKAFCKTVACIYRLVTVESYRVRPRPQGSVRQGATGTGPAGTVMNRQEVREAVRIGCDKPVAGYQAIIGSITVRCMPSGL